MTCAACKLIDCWKHASLHKRNCHLDVMFTKFHHASNYLFSEIQLFRFDAKWHKDEIKESQTQIEKQKWTETVEWKWKKL